MNSFKLIATDTIKYDALNTLKEYDNKCKLPSDLDKYLPFWQYIDNEQVTKQSGQFFPTSNDPSVEWIYIMAFVFGCKDFIKNNIDVYKKASDKDGQNWYERMKDLVLRFKTGAKLNKTNYEWLNDLKLDPCPKFPECYECPKCPKCPKCPEPKKSFKDTNQTNNCDKPNYLLYTGIATVLFLLLSNQMVYDLLNQLFKVSLNKYDCPTQVGNIIHAILFFIMFYLVFKYSNL